MKEQERHRGFEVAKGFEKKGINLPVASTTNAAGYDFECSEDTVIPSIWRIAFNWACYRANQTVLFENQKGSMKDTEDESIHDVYDERFNKFLKPTLVPTGIKSYMKDKEVLFLYNRSSGPLKKFLFMSNGVGVIDSDYYSNESNDGHIMFQFINFGLLPVTIKKGERVGQGVFQKFLKADVDVRGGKRKGGHGSTGK